MYRGNDREDIVELVSRVLDYRNFNEFNFKLRVPGYLPTKKKEERKSVSGYPLAIRSFDRRERRDREMWRNYQNIGIARELMVCEIGRFFFWSMCVRLTR